MDLGVLLSFSQSFQSPQPSGWTLPPPLSAARFTSAPRTLPTSRHSKAPSARVPKLSLLAVRKSRPSAALALSAQRPVELEGLDEESLDVRRHCAPAEYPHVTASISQAPDDETPERTGTAVTRMGDVMAPPNMITPCHIDRVSPVTTTMT